jgi:hypothetical protein
MRPFKVDPKFKELDEQKKREVEAVLGREISYTEWEKYKRLTKIKHKG